MKRRTILMRSCISAALALTLMDLAISPASAGGPGGAVPMDPLAVIATKWNAPYEYVEMSCRAAPVLTKGKLAILDDSGEVFGTLLPGEEISRATENMSFPYLVLEEAVVMPHPEALNEDPMTIPAGHVITFLRMPDVASPPVEGGLFVQARSCSVSCNAATHYACCESGFWGLRCYYVPNSTSSAPVCDDGGSGATSCSVTADQPQPLQAAPGAVP